ncbi:MAG: glycosyltransferase family 87 protein [Dehalococcoidia bacterium]
MNRPDTPGLCRRPSLRLLSAGLLLLLLGMYVLLAPETGKRVDQDWSHLWLGGRMIVTGHTERMYDPELQVEVYRQADPAGRPPAVWTKRNEILGCFYYPPPTAVPYAALAWLPRPTAAVANAYLTLGLTLLLAGMLARNIDPRLPWAAVAAIILAYPPFFINLSLGQNGVFSTFLLVAAWCLCNRRRDLLAGLVLGLFICKPNWLLAIGWIPLVHRRWRVLLGMCLGAASVLAATLILLGPRPFVDYADLFHKVSKVNQIPGYRLSLQYNGLGLFRKWLGTGSTAAGVLGGASCILLALVTWRVCRGAWQPGTRRFQLMMACSLMAALWINPHLYYYDLVPAAICLVPLVLDWKMLGRTGRAVAVLVSIFTYAAVPWDRLWSWGTVFPVPCFAILALWGWFAYRLACPYAERSIPEEGLAPGSPTDPRSTGSVSPIQTPPGLKPAAR